MLTSLTSCVNLPVFNWRIRTNDNNWQALTSASMRILQDSHLLREQGSAIILERKMDTKVCTACKKEKDITEFAKHKRYKNGISWCRQCIREYGSERRKKYPLEIYAWTNMRTRCNNPNSAKYPRYGGRGIKVCPEWATFKQFYEDMGPKPTPRHQIDRADNDGDYCPENCRWVTPAENARNCSRTKLSREKVAAIRESYAAGGCSHRQLAKQYGVTHNNIGAITRKQIWRDVL